MNDFLIKVIEQEFDSKIKIISFKQCWENESMAEYIVEFVYRGAHLYKNVLIAENNKSKEYALDNIKKEIKAFDNVIKEDNELKQVAYIYRNVLYKYEKQLRKRYNDKIKEHSEIVAFVEKVKNEKAQGFIELYKMVLNDFTKCLDKNNKKKTLKSQ